MGMIGDSIEEDVKIEGSNRVSKLKEAGFGNGQILDGSWRNSII
jgi:hypothetical protein